MDFKRAEEIFHSLGVIEVFYKGNPIWISELFPQNETAEIKQNKKESDFQVVSVSELTE